ncbi:Amino_acid transporter family protein [Hexamita inflata]|uniref:Amino_acid transporter family protein n=1 Tax=Hexamita inflata TaxID=28002 RepID=A0ABP1H8X1_9EUKA
MSIKQTQLTSTTLLSQMMGASLLSCAFIFHRLGYVLTLLAFTITILFNLFAYKYYVNMAYYIQASSYRELTEKVISKKLSLVLDVSIMVTAFGFMTSYIIISSTAIINFFQNIFEISVNKYIIKAIISLLIIFPLTLLKSLKTLSKISVISGIAIFITAITVVVYFFIHLQERQLCMKNETEYITYKIDAFPQVSIIKAILYFLMYIPSLQGNFTAHRVIPTLMKELQGPLLLKKKVVSISINIAMFMALILYLTVGLMGSAMFGDDIKDNILKSFAPCKWVWIDICSLVYGMVVINTYPLVLYPIKMSIVNLCKQEPSTKDGYKIQVIVSIVYVILTTTLAMTVEQILPIFGLFSSLTGIIFYFVVPICFYINYPKIKKQNSHIDKQQIIDTQTADPVIVSLVSMLSINITETSINKIRTLSQILFPENTKVEPQRTVSMFRPKTFSSNSFSVVNVSKHDSSMLQGDQEPRVSRLNFQTEIQVAQIIQNGQNTLENQDDEFNLFKEQDEYQENLKINISISPRKIFGIFLICMFSFICAVGVYMNGSDVIRAIKG